MTRTRLFAERFLVEVGDEGPLPPSGEYDEARSITVAEDGTPAVEGDTEQTKTYDQRAAAFYDTDDPSSCAPWASTTTQTFVREEEPADRDHHITAWAGTVTDIKGPAIDAD
ncbi:MAG TPA: hypothetical protein VF517_16540 [Thermoleophilaceae bacterium]|jgi:hypothetical protein